MTDLQLPLEAPRRRRFRWRLVAGIILGISETIVLTLLGASWAPAVSFGLLLVMLGIRPQGLFGR